MKKTVLYCDRHNGAHPAVTTVWLRAVGMSRTMKLDVCEEAFRAIVGGVIAGAAENGTPLLPAPTEEPRKPDRRAKGFAGHPGSDTGKLFNGAVAFIKKMHRRFTLDEITQAMESVPLKRTKKEKIKHRLGPVIRELVRSGELERHGVFGVFSPKELPKVPPPTLTPSERASLIAKTVRAYPGVRVAYLPGLLDLQPSAIKRSLAQLTEMGLVKRKGQRSVSRAWAQEQKGK